MQQRTTTAPQQPDIDDTWTPPITHLRTNRARNVNTNPVTAPVTRRAGMLQYIIRGIMARWLPLAFGSLLIVGLLVGYNNVVAPWWQGIQNQWHYGDARITQIDANVGHGGESHFIAEFYQGKIIVIELSLTNPSNYHTYVLNPVDTTVKNPAIQLSLADANHDGRLDLVIQIEGSDFELILYNTGTGFTEG